MDDRGISISEANNIIESLNKGKINIGKKIKVGEYSLMEWIIIVIQRTKKPIHMSRFINTFFLIYYSIILECDPLYLEFTKTENGVNSFEVSETIDTLILIHSSKLIESIPEDKEGFEIPLSDKDLEHFSELKKISDKNLDSVQTLLYKYDMIPDEKLKELVFDLFDKYKIKMNTESVMWMKEGQRLSKKNQFEKSLVYYNRILQMNSSDVEAWKQRGISFKKIGDSKEAQICFNKVQEIQKRNEDTQKRNEDTQKRNEDTQKRNEDTGYHP